MAITAASIEANGWVLAITHNRGLGSFGNYVLSPDATPALTLTSQHPGYDFAGGVAVPNAAKPRSFTGTKPLRQAAVVSNAGVLSAKAIDETDNGGGSVTVRIALSNWVYATDTSIVLNFLAGWRTSETAGSISVINNSTQTCPAPIHRWADVPSKLQRGSFDIEMLVFGFFPQGNQPVAAVKFTVTDGTTVKTFWSSALSSSTQFGDNLRCYRATVDPSTATALTAGLLRIDATVYPWIGTTRVTDVAGTRAMATLATSSTQFGAGDGMLGKAQAPFVVAWDPAGTRYPFKCVFVDFTNGVTGILASAGGTAPAQLAAMIGSGSSEAAALAAAKAVAPGSRAKDCTQAVEALRAAGFSYPAGNGQAAASNIVDGCRIVLAPGVHANGTGAMSPGFSPWCVETWLRIEGDPADANPRQTVIVRTNTIVSGDFRSNVQRVAYGSMSIELGYDLLLYCRYQWWDNVELRGQTGQTTSSRAPIGGASPPATYLGLFATRTRIWKTGVSFDSTFGGSSRFKLLRGVEHRRKAEAPLCVKNRVISEFEDPSLTGFLGTTITGSLSAWGDDLSVYDSIVAYCDLRANKEAMWNTGFLPAAKTSHPVYPASQFRRQVLFGCIGERIGNIGNPGTMNFDKMFSCGEQTQADMYECVVESNTVVGERVNWGYNDATIALTLAATDAQAQNTYVNCRVAGNMFGGEFSKHDRFDDPIIKSQRQSGPAWTPSNFPLGQQMASGGNLYQVTTAGSSGGTAPTGTGTGIQPAGSTCVYSYVSAFTPDVRNHGVRPQNTGCYASLYGVGQRDNVNLTETFVGPQTETVLKEYDGLNCLFTNAPVDPKYTNDQSRWRLGVDQVNTATGGGDYTPLAGSPALGRVANGNSDVDIAGKARAVTFAAGAIEAAVVSTSLVPASARHTGLVSIPGVRWTSVISGSSTLLATRTGVGSVSWSGVVAGTRNTLATRSGVAGLGWATLLAASRSLLATRAVAAGLSWATVVSGVRSALTIPAATAGLSKASWAGALASTHGTLTLRAGAAAIVAAGHVSPSPLEPNSSTHALGDAFGLIMQPGGSDGGTIRSILVPSDFRVHSITLS